MLGEALEAAGQHLAHRGEVVLALDGADAEAAVLVVARAAVLEHHHRGHRVAALDRRDVVALDAARAFRQVELVLEHRERRLGLVAVGEPAHAVHRERLVRVLLGGRDQGAQLAALRDGDLDGAAALRAQRLAQLLAVGGRVREQHAARHVRRRLEELREERAQHLGVAGVGRLARAVEHERVGVGDDGAAHEEDLHAGLVVAAREGEDVGVEGGGGRHALALGDAADRLGLVAQVCGALELEPRGGLAHLPLDVSQHVVAAALEEEQRLVDHGAVFLGRAVGRAGGDAALDVVVEAGAGVRCR